MARSRVFSVLSTLGGNPRFDKRKDSPSPPRPEEIPVRGGPSNNDTPPIPLNASSKTMTMPHTSMQPGGRPRASSRPMSMIGGYQPPQMEIASDTIPELAPVFTFLNTHSNKLYQEGYFLKLNDLDSHGRPYGDRSWTECFAQLVGTVLSVWDAAALDEAGEDGEVAPTFINISDASIKMIDSLPTRSTDGQPLQHVLSVSTAGRNRYLFHFSNNTALTQWTAGIRLSMFENSSLQEAYTGCLIAGKGKSLNNIKTIMTTTQFKTEEWTRVRFGAGTPWRRCWCVIAPPDEKELAQHKKAMKKRSAYDRSRAVLKGDIKFYDTRKIKKNTQPIATIRDAYAAYAIYPQSKSLIENSTLIKIEGVVTIHSQPETTTEGFIFIMPETRPAVSGFEMMLRFIFPIYDIFNLYGRPARLIPDTLDTRSLMFAMPQGRRYGYLEIFDVATLIHTKGSHTWNEKDWKLKLKTLTSQRLSKSTDSSEISQSTNRRSKRTSMPIRPSALRFKDNASTPSLLRDSGLGPAVPEHTDSAPPGAGPFSPPGSRHQRSASENYHTPLESPNHLRDSAGSGYMGAGYANGTPHRLSTENEVDEELYEQHGAPAPPQHGVPILPQYGEVVTDQGHGYDSANRHSGSSNEEQFHEGMEHQDPDIYSPDMRSPHQEVPPGHVAAPPAFSHQPGAKPQNRPTIAPELRRANSRMSSATLSQLAAASNANKSTMPPPPGQVPTASSEGLVVGGVVGGIAAAGAAAAWGRRGSQQEEERRVSPEKGQRGVNDEISYSHGEMTADTGVVNKGLVIGSGIGPDPDRKSASSREASPNRQLRSSSPNNLAAPRSQQPRSTSPLSHSSNLSEEPEKPAPPYASENTPTGSQSSLNSNRLSMIARKPINKKPLAAAAAAAAYAASTPPRAESPTKLDTSAPPPPPHASNADVVASPDHDPGYKVDEFAFGRVATMRSEASAGSGLRQNSGDSVYSTESPTYASTRASEDVPPPVSQRDQPRTGVLKTVGQAEEPPKDVVVGEAHYRSDSQAKGAESSDFSFDFGPTQYYSAGLGTPGSENAPPKQQAPRPTSMMPTALHDRPMSTEPAGGLKPRDSWTPQSQSRVSPGGIIDAYGKSPVNSNYATPESGNSRTGSADGPPEKIRTMAWNPTGSQAVQIGGSTNTAYGALSAEQYVQQKAEKSRVTHTRKLTKTPPLSHSRQGSKTPPVNSRNSSGDFTSRPGSRGASMILNPQDTSTSHLTAREQEHVARMTGSPLINMATNAPAKNQQGAGLVGAIEAREREKKDFIKQGSNKIVKQAIAQRQQQAAAANNYRAPAPPQHAANARYSNVPSPQPQQQQQSYDRNWYYGGQQQQQAFPGHMQYPAPQQQQQQQQQSPPLPQHQQQQPPMHQQRPIPQRTNSGNFPQRTNSGNFPQRTSSGNWSEQWNRYSKAGPQSPQQFQPQQAQSPQQQQGLYHAHPPPHDYFPQVPMQPVQTGYRQPGQAPAYGAYGQQQGQQQGQPGQQQQQQFGPEGRYSGYYPQQPRQ